MPQTQAPTVERFQEITVNRGVPLHVDREQGLIRGVKILGLASANGREYDRAAVDEAKGLYEGIAVNVDHAEGSGPRSYRDRIGRLSLVEARPDGLYGTLKVNKAHALADQLFEDAEHSPENVGLSHDATGRTKRRNGKTVVEAITCVRSVDLVAEPATTAGLFEHVNPQEGDAVQDTTLKEATAAQLKEQRPDLLDSLRAELAEADDAKAVKAENAELKAKLAEAEKRDNDAQHREAVKAELAEAKLDDVPETFLGVLLAEGDVEKRKALIDDRRKLIEAAGKAGKPKSAPAGSSGGTGDDDGGAFDFDHFSEAIQEPVLG